MIGNYSSVNIKVTQAFLERDTSTFSSMDPYVVVKIGDSSQKTRVATGQGKRPKWNESLYFKLKTADRFIDVRVMDKNNFGGDNIIGSCEIPLSELNKGASQFKETYNLYYKTKYVGTIKLTFEPISETKANLGFMANLMSNKFANNPQPQPTHMAHEYIAQPAPQIHHPGNPATTIFGALIQQQQQQAISFPNPAMRPSHQMNTSPSPFANVWRSPQQTADYVNNYPTLEQAMSPRGAMSNQDAANALASLGLVSPFLLNMAKNQGNFTNNAELPPGFLNGQPPSNDHHY